MQTTSTAAPALSRPVDNIAALNAAAHATTFVLDEVLELLANEGERLAAIRIRRHFNHWPPNHQCVMDMHGECVCGRSL